VAVLSGSGGDFTGSTGGSKVGGGSGVTDSSGMDSSGGGAYSGGGVSGFLVVDFFELILIKPPKFVDQYDCVVMVLLRSEMLA